MPSQATIAALTVTGVKQTAAHQDKLDKLLLIPESCSDISENEKSAASGKQETGCQGDCKRKRGIGFNPIQPISTTSPLFR